MEKRSDTAFSTEKCVAIQSLLKDLQTRGGSPGSKLLMYIQTYPEFCSHRP